MKWWDFFFPLGQFGLETPDSWELGNCFSVWKNPRWKLDGSELVYLKIKESDSFLIRLSGLHSAQVIWLFMFRAWVNNYKVDAIHCMVLGG